MKKKLTKFKGLFVFSGEKYYDKRGYLREVFLEKKLKKKIKFSIVSCSNKNVLRGMHYQIKDPQDKFITVLKGKILDVVVDLRKKSKTFGKYFKIELNEKNNKFLFVPKGFAHGFLGLGKENIVLYSLTNYRNSRGERSLHWKDKHLKIKWGVKNPIVSKRDSKAKSFKEIIDLNEF
mgnify:CR=1 FL=1